MDALIIVLICAGLTLLIRYLNCKGKRLHTPIPTMKSYPIIGSILELKPDKMHEQFSELAKRHGEIFQFKMFGNTSIVLNTVEMINKAFCLDEFKGVFCDRPQLYIGNYIGGRNNITFRNCNKAHAYLRKCLTKSMHVYGDGISAFEDVMKSEMHRVMKYIQTCEGNEFDVVALARRSLSNVMTILLIGEQATDSDVTCYTDLINGLDIFLNPMVNLVLSKLPFLRFTPFFKPAFDKTLYSYRWIIDKMFINMKGSCTPGKYRGIVDWYFEEQQREKEFGGEQTLTDDVIKAMIIDILVAGIITTSSVLPAIFLCLKNHPEYQRKIQEELDRVVGKNRESVVKDRNECHFLQAVVIETLRLVTPVPFLLPHLCSKDTVFEGYLVHENTQVLANVWHIHHDEKIWQDPWVFRPDRFLDANAHLLPGSDMHVKSWLPFGIGRRKCPGMNLASSRLFLYVSYLLQKWSFEAPEGPLVSCDPREDGYEFNLLVKPKPFYCIARKRQ